MKLLYVTGNDNLDQLVKVVSVRSLYCKFTICLFEITKYFWKILREHANILFLLKLCSLVLAFIR